MRKFDTEISCCFSERQYNNIIYGRESPYISCDIDYKRDIQMLCIKNVMEYSVEREDSYITYGFSVYAASLKHFPLLEACLDMEKANNKGHEISRLISQKLEQENGKIEGLKNYVDQDDDFGALDILQNVGKSKEDELRVENMLRDLDLCNHTFYLNDKVPKEMTSLVEQFVKNLYRILEIDANPTVVTNQKQQSGKEQEAAQKGIFVRDGVIVLKDIYFDDVFQTSFLGEIFEDRIPHICRAVFFDHCCFDIPHHSMGVLCEESIMFKNCHFKQGFRWMGQANASRLIFDDCVISDEMEITLPYILGLYINDCIFEKDSSLKLDWIGREHSISNVFITDCVFHGGFELSRWRKLSLKMNNVTFYKPFIIKDTIFREYTKITNLCFPTTATPEMEASKKQLYDSLVESGLNKIAENLNLLSGKTQKKKKEIDLAAYQIAYNTGWLNNIFAAYCLGRTPNYLSKKRMADMKMVTQQSLPFKGTGKDIQYPVEALLAFKAKDWDTLKNLRKKYPIPTK